MHTVCSVSKSGPAARVGVRAGDKLEAVDGMSVNGASHWVQVAKMIRGPRGSEVNITLSRSGLTQELFLQRESEVLLSYHDTPILTPTDTPRGACSPTLPDCKEEATKMPAKSLKFEGVPSGNAQPNDGSEYKHNVHTAHATKKAQHSTDLHSFVSRI
jgi:hypothetical protein